MVAKMVWIDLKVVTYERDLPGSVGRSHFLAADLETDTLVLLKDILCRAQ